jgi:hypothetical protein
VTIMRRTASDMHAFHVPTLRTNPSKTRPPARHTLSQTPSGFQSYGIEAMSASMAVMRRRQQAEQGLDAGRNAGDEEAFLDYFKRLVAK